MRWIPSESEVSQSLTSELLYLMYVLCLFAESHKLGLHYLANGHSSEVVMMREKRLIDTFAVKSGMLRFNFMIESCHPGSVPDAHLIAALLHLVTMCLQSFF